MLFDTYCGFDWFRGEVIRACDCTNGRGDASNDAATEDLGSEFCQLLSPVRTVMLQHC